MTAAGLLISVAALACAPVAIAQSTIRIDGSSTVFPVTEAVAEEFQAAHRGSYRVPVGVSGTGGGFKKFYRGEIDICDASRPILASEMRECIKAGIEYIELPIAFDALTVMVHPSNTFVDKFTVEELKKIWAPEAQGKVTHWDQVRAGWPHERITLYGAGADSGTFDYFTEAICGKAKSSRGDYTASEDDNTLVQGIAGDRNALGYFGFAYYASNKDKLKAVPVVNPQGKAVGPSVETVMDGSYNPLSRPIFIYVNRKSLDRAEVRKFVEFYLTQGPELVKEVKYVPLPANAYEKAAERVQKVQTGTAFGGHAETGLHIDELFKRALTSKPRGE
jgi:phosphate transport system substrate-binding protein